MAVIVHTSDFLLDTDFFPYAEKVRPQRKADLLASFGRIVDFCIESDAHLLIISGNLFSHHNPDNEVLTQVISRLDDLGRLSPRTHVAMTPGPGEIFKTHAETRTALGLFRHLSKVSVLSGPEDVLRLETEDHSIAVGAVPPDIPRDPAAIARNLPQLDAEIGILLWSIPIGDLTALFNDPDFDLAALLSRRGVKYLAAGGEPIHQMGLQGQVLWAYPGSPEIVTFEEPSVPRGFCVLNPRDRTLHKNDLRFHPLPTRNVINIEVLCSLEDTDITAKVRDSLPDPDPGAVVRVSIMGEVTFEVYRKFRRARLGERMAEKYFDFIVDNDLFILDDRDQFDFRELLVEKPKVEFKKFMEQKLAEIQATRPEEVKVYQDLLALGLNEIDEEIEEA